MEAKKHIAREYDQSKKDDPQKKRSQRDNPVIIITRKEPAQINKVETEATGKEKKRISKTKFKCNRTRK